MNRPHHSNQAGVSSQVSRSIERLRELLLGAPRLEDVWQAFDEALGTNEAFLRLGNRSEHPTLKAVVEAVVPKAVPRPGRLLDLSLLVLPSHGLWHGGALFEASVCTVLYFEAENRGMLSISKGLLVPDVVFARFSFPPLPKDSFPVRGPAEGV